MCIYKMAENKSDNQGSESCCYYAPFLALPMFEHSQGTPVPSLSLICHEN